MRKITIAGNLEFLGFGLDGEYEDLMAHVRRLMGEEVEQMLRKYTCQNALTGQCKEEDE